MCVHKYVQDDIAEGIVKTKTRQMDGGQTEIDIRCICEKLSYIFMREWTTTSEGRQSLEEC